MLKLCLYLHLPDEHSYPLPAFPSSKPIVLFFESFFKITIISDFSRTQGKEEFVFHEMFFLGENALL